MKENDKQNFERPELPFLLIYESRDNGISYSWFATEEELRETVKEVESYGDLVMYAMEIDNARDVELNSQNIKSVVDKKFNYQVSFSAEDYLTGTVKLTKDQAEAVKYATDLENWEDIDGERAYCGTFYIDVDNPMEI